SLCGGRALDPCFFLLFADFGCRTLRFSKGAGFSLFLVTARLKPQPYLRPAISKLSSPVFSGVGFVYAGLRSRGLPSIAPPRDEISLLLPPTSISATRACRGALPPPNARDKRFAQRRGPKILRAGSHFCFSDAREKPEQNPA